jgi:hypothetical protein
MANYQLLLDLVSDPISGPFEGEDFWIDPDGTIQIAENNVKIAALLMRKVNTSGSFTQNLVKIGQRGDSILLGFDTLLDVDPVHSAKIGFKSDTLAEVKRDINGRFCVYVNGKRLARMFAKLTQAKQMIKKLDKDLQSAADVPEDLDD